MESDATIQCKMFSLPTPEQAHKMYKLQCHWENKLHKDLHFKELFIDQITFEKQMQISLQTIKPNQSSL
jgi:hypothetical protein